MLDYVHAALRRPRRALVVSTIERKRQEHPELRGSVTLADLRQVAAREGIDVSYASPLPGRAIGVALMFLGARVVMLEDRLPVALRRHVLAHELAHHWAGHCENAMLRAWRAVEIERWRDDTDVSRGVIYDRTEDEADLIAAGLLGLSVADFRAPIEAFLATANRTEAA
jgi:hypothetical protein